MVHLPSYVTISITSFHCNYLINHYLKANRNRLGKMLNTNYDEGFLNVCICVLLGCLVQITHRTMPSAFGWTAYFALTIHKVFEHMHRTIHIHSDFISAYCNSIQLQNLLSPVFAAYKLFYPGKSHTNIWHTQLDNTILDNNNKNTNNNSITVWHEHEKKTVRIQRIFNANFQFMHRICFFFLLMVLKENFIWFDLFRSFL